MQSTIAPVLTCILCLVNVASFANAQTSPDGPFVPSFPEDSFPIREYPIQVPSRYQDPLQTWRMKDGLTFEAKPYCTPFRDIQFGNSSPATKQQLNFQASIDDLTEEDKRRLLETCYLLPKSLFKFLHYRAIEISPKWNSDLGTTPNNVGSIVHFDNVAYYFRRSHDIIVVRKDGLTQDTQREIESKLSKTLHTIELHPKLASVPLIGRPVQSSGNFWIVEFTNRSDLDSTPTVGRKPINCFLYPKRYLEPLGEEILTEALKSVHNEFKLTHLETDDINKLPVCLMGDRDSPIFVSQEDGYVQMAKSKEDDKVIAITESGTKDQKHINSLPVDTQFAVYKLAFIQQGKDTEQAEKIALARVLKDLDEAIQWTVRQKNTYGQPVGVIEEGIVFKTSKRDGFFCPAHELDPVTRKIALAKISSSRTN